MDVTKLILIPDQSTVQMSQETKSNGLINVSSFSFSFGFWFY